MMSAGACLWFEADAQSLVYRLYQRTRLQRSGEYLSYVMVLFSVLFCVYHIQHYTFADWPEFKQAMLMITGVVLFPAMVDVWCWRRGVGHIMARWEPLLECYRRSGGDPTAVSQAISEPSFHSGCHLLSEQACRRAALFVLSLSGAVSGGAGIIYTLLVSPTGPSLPMMAWSAIVALTSALWLNCWRKNIF